MPTLGGHPGGVRRAVALEDLGMLGAGVGIEEPTLDRGLFETDVLVLPMDLDVGSEERGEQRGRDQPAADAGPTAARRWDLPRDDEHTVLREPPQLGDRLSRVAIRPVLRVRRAHVVGTFVALVEVRGVGRRGDAEHGLDDRSVPTAADEFTRGASAQEQLERGHDHRLAGTRLTGHDGQAGCEHQRGVVDDPEPTDVQLLDHPRLTIRPSSLHPGLAQRGPSAQRGGYRRDLRPPRVTRGLWTSAGSCEPEGPPDPPEERWAAEASDPYGS